MSGQVLPFHSSAHATADALLPWYVNGTLAAEELRFVEQHLDACEQCRHEVDWLREVFVACGAMGEDTGAAATAVPRRLDAGTAGQRRPNWAGRMAGGWQTARPWMRGLLAAQLATIAILGTLLATDTRNEPSYQTLGAAAPSAQARDAIAVMFDPAATEAELQRILMRADARIVDGPTVTNAFVLEVPADQAERAVQALRAEPRVQLAERLGARSPK